MRCLKHNSAAIAICANCGAGLCVECSAKSASDKFCCGPQCIEALSLVEEASRLTLDRATKMATASSYGSYLLSLVFLGFALFGALNNMVVLAIFMGLSGGGMLAMGFFYQRSASWKRPVNKAKQPGTP